MTQKRVLGVVAAAMLAAAVPAGASANVQVGSSGWEWGNPLPRATRCGALSFSSDRGYAAGTSARC